MSRSEAETGIRGGEICALRVEDLDLENGVIRVRQSVWRGKVQTVKSRQGNRRFRSLQEGQTVEFDVTKGPKGFQAENVRPV